MYIRVVVQQFIPIVIILPLFFFPYTAPLFLIGVSADIMCVSVTFHAEGNLFQAEAACGTLFFPTTYNEPAHE